MNKGKEGNRKGGWSDEMIIEEENSESGTRESENLYFKIIK